MAVLPPDLARSVAARSATEHQRLDAAYRFAAAAHTGQKRLSGKEFISHPVAVARILAEMGLDTETLMAALLHDVIEDCGVTAEEIGEKFGLETRFLVEAVTKIKVLDTAGQFAAKADSLRKMLLAMGRDIRVILIKLADRSHNLETVKFLPRVQRERIARETLEIYAPLAHRLGMERMRNYLEELSFATLEPARYDQLKTDVEQYDRQRQERVAELIAQTEKLLANVKITAKIFGRPKNLYGIYRKMRDDDKPLAKIYDLLGLRIVTTSVRDCYGILGELHRCWPPVPGRFKDYIAMPKSNMYQSVHTTVLCPDGKMVEFQLRTEAMHRHAEEGIAAHWIYKESKGKTPSETAELEKFGWYRQVIDTLRDVSDPRELMKLLKVDFFQKEVYVFTPRGEIKELPAGSTPVDFAFAIHTEVGTGCTGARVNGKMVPLSRELHSGDVVEVITSKGHRPSRDWLKFVRTAAARSVIRRLLKEEDRQHQRQRGRELVAKHSRQAGLRLERLSKHERLAAGLAEFKLDNLEELYLEVGRGEVSPRAFINRLEAKPSAGPEDRGVPQGEAPPRGGGSVIVAGISAPDAHMARCCTPLSGDRVFGYITRGRGVTVHREDCSNAARLHQDPERIVEITWRRTASSRSRLGIHVEGTDRQGLLADISVAISAAQGNIASCRTVTDAGYARFTFALDLEDSMQLDEIKSRLLAVEGVTSVKRR